MESNSTEQFRKEGKHGRFHQTDTGGGLCKPPKTDEWGAGLYGRSVPAYVATIHSPRIISYSFDECVLSGVQHSVGRLCERYADVPF
jgi:hypothetical protein